MPIERTTQLPEDHRSLPAAQWLANLGQDFRHSLRSMRKNALFSALVVLVLGMGIGANTAVFSIVNEVILKPLPFRDPSRLLAVWDTYVPQFAKIGVSPVEFQAWQSQTDVFTETAWYRYVPFESNLVLPNGESIAAHADLVSSNLFSMLGVSPRLGRGFSAHEDPKSALLSDQLWRTRFAADHAIVGKAIRFNGAEFTITGVMPPGAQFPDWADFWLPQGPLLGDELTNPVRHALGFLARLRPGITEAQADSRLQAIAQRLAGQHKATSTGWGMRVTNLQADLTGDVRPTLLLLLGAAALLLLIACANIASLLLARASTRAKEMAVRAAVGASSARIVRQLITENLVLALLGGLAGLLLAKAGLIVILPAHAHLDPSVLLFLIAASFATGLLFGLAPAIHTLRADAQSLIKSAAVTGSGVKTRSALVVLEFALTLTLVIAAAILARSFIRLMRVNPGFTPGGVLSLKILTPPATKPDVVFHRIQQQLLSIGGVESVAATNALPLVASRAFASRFNVPGSPLINPDALPSAQIRIASPDYFQTMRIALRSGRAFTERDLKDPVVIVNETMAARYWPGRDPIGLKFVTGVWGPTPSWSTIIGVAADVKDFGLDSEPTMDMYFPNLGGQYLVVRTNREVAGLAGGIERIVHSADPELAVSDIQSMDEIARDSARTRRWTMGLLAAFASLAFLLALIGIYGVIAWSVAQRTRELGVRLALGAQRRQVVLLVLNYGVKLALAGMAMGLVAAFVLRRTLASLVYGVSTADPLVYLLVPAVMFAVALLACYVPARRAAHLDPIASLRYE